MNDLVSVVIPVYNVEAYLEECVKSVLRQTYSNLEIVLVDDGSTDSSGDLCDKLLPTDPRLTVIHKKNGGLSDARNAGTLNAHGEYIMYLDSDDYIADQTIQFLMEALQQTNADIASCLLTRDPKELNAGSGKVIYFNAKDALIEMLYDGQVIASACAKLYKRNIATAMPFETGRIFEDYLYSITITTKSNGVAFVDRSLYFYRVNEQSITQNVFTEKNFDLLHASDCVENVIKNFDDKLLKYVYIRRSLIIIELFIRCSLANAEKVYGKEIRKKLRSHYFRFLFSKKSFKLKLLGIAIIVSPRIAKRIIRKHFSNKA